MIGTGVLKQGVFTDISAATVLGLKSPALPPLGHVFNLVDGDLAAADPKTRTTGVGDVHNRGHRASKVHITKGKQVGGQGHLMLNRRPDRHQPFSSFFDERVHGAKNREQGTVKQHHISDMAHQLAQLVARQSSNRCRIGTRIYHLVKASERRRDDPCATIDFKTKRRAVINSPLHLMDGEAMSTEGLI
jgi:hypothetical protein